jgi:energy-coupling factor transporter ATP-binding protein EcfA2
VARALAGPGRPLITNDDVRWLLDKAGAYVVEDLGPGQRSVYRPFHDVLAAYLRGEPSDTEPGSGRDLAAKDAWDRHQSETEKVITNALLETVPVDATGQRQWDTAHPYLKTYLFRHAADTGTEAASALVQDLSFLAVTDQVTFSPYRGLAAYGPSDAQFFFGREDETSAVVTLMAKRLEKPELLMVCGPSGVGKSSLLEAGVLVALRRGALPAPGAESWPIIVFTPGRSPLLELASRTAALAGTDAATVLHGLQTDPAAFADTARQAVLAASTRAAGDHEAMQQPQPRLLIIVDQFEQLFTASSDEEERQAFITALHAAATTRTGPAQVSPALVVLAVRADFYAHCARYPDLINALQAPYLVGPMSALQLRRAITGPAQAAGFQIEPGLVDLLLHDATGYSGEVALPLLSYALDQIWRSRSGEVLTFADYRRTGGINGAVARGADSAYDRLTRSQQTMTRRLFMRLIATSENGEETAHPVSRTELTGSLPPSQAEDLSTVIEAFTSSRLLTITSDAIAISQEVLLTAWPRLRGWLDEFRTDHIIRTQLSAAATEWVNSNRDVAFLLTGSRLTVTQHAMAQMNVYTDQLPLGPIERDFLQASMRSYRRSIRRRHIAMVLLLVLLVGFVTETFVLLSR